MGVRAEVIDDNLYILASPSSYHASLSAKVKLALWRIILENDLGEIHDTPMDIFLKNGTIVVIPDIVFISKENQSAKVKKRGVYGPPDLHIEILSPGNSNYDLAVKKSLYEESGVKEYWIVDPESKNAQGYLLRDGNYGEPLLTNSSINIRIINKTIYF